MFQVAFPRALLTAFPEPLVGDPLGPDEHRAPGVHGGLVAGAVPEKLRAGKHGSIYSFSHYVDIRLNTYILQVDQLDLTPDIKAFNMPFDTCHRKDRDGIHDYSISRVKFSWTTL